MIIGYKEELKIQYSMLLIIVRLRYVRNIVLNVEIKIIYVLLIGQIVFISRLKIYKI
jgi:hypothetical protein